jgi:uncharacterized protein YehS (DUF1456 family)
MAMLELDDASAAALFAKGGHTVDPSDIPRLRARSSASNALDLDDDGLRAFLNGLIVERRGASTGPLPTPPPGPMRGNEVLKKLRVAFELHEPGMRRAFANGGAELSKANFTSLFRSPSHRGWRECSDELLFQFLRGLATMQPP